MKEQPENRVRPAPSAPSEAPQRKKAPPPPAAPETPMPETAPAQTETRSEDRTTDTTRLRATPEKEPERIEDRRAARTQVATVDEERAEIQRARGGMPPAPDQQTTRLPAPSEQTIAPAKALVNKHGGDISIKGDEADAQERLAESEGRRFNPA